MPISTTLVILRSVSGIRRPSAGGAAPGQSPMRSRASRIWPDDLFRLEVAHQPLRAGVAERAGQRAADLAGDAQRAAVGFGDVDRLDLGRARLMAALGKPQQPFARAVGRHLLGDDLGAVEGVGSLGERGAQVLGDVGHLVERRRAARIDPAPELADAHAAAACRARRWRPAQPPALRGRGRRARAGQQRAAEGERRGRYSWGRAD